ncbi:hypothetical protein [Sodalis sp.]|uniref:hypothetical protein n=1 Tax=Sodalis sp. (in: enterobacteria) TaxID=1898979 RepID=UPI003873C61E
MQQTYSATQFSLLPTLAAVGRVYVSALSPAGSLNCIAVPGFTCSPLSFHLMLCRTTLTATQQTGVFYYTSRPF